MRNILVIDDERPTLEAIELLLEAMGYAVTMAETGDEGVAAFNDKRPDIVLTDIKMPGMDGIEVLSRIKETEPGAEVIVITGHGDMDLAMRALQLDATDFINKPVGKDALKRALERAEQRLDIAGADASYSVEKRDTPGGQALLARIHGNLAMGSQALLGELAKACTAEPDKALVLVFEESAAINGSGVQHLSDFLEECKAQRDKLAVAGLSASMTRLYNLMGLASHALVYPDAESALAALYPEGGTGA